MPGSQVYGSGNGPTYPLSRRELRKVYQTGQFGASYQFQDFDASRDVEVFFEDFGGAALDATNDFTVPTCGASATTWAVLSGGQNGRLRGIIGATSATSALQLARPTNFLSAQNVGMEVFWYPSATLNNRFEIGFVNALPAINTTIVNSLTTPTFNTVTDGCVYVYDDTAPTNALYTISSVASGVAHKVVCSPLNLPVAATVQHVRLEIKSNNCFLWLNGQLVASQTGSGATSACNPTTLLLPCFMSVKNSSTTAGNVDIDYVRVWSDRLVQSS